LLAAVLLSGYLAVSDNLLPPWMLGALSFAVYESAEGRSSIDAVKLGVKG
jgi:hypothetical protein